MHEKYTEENLLEYLKRFQIDAWKSLSIKEKEYTMQWIVDYMAAQIGLPSLCNVKIEELDNTVESGFFEHNTHNLYIEKELAEDCLKPPYHTKRTPDRNHILATKEIIETLMHEFRHAYQQYVYEHANEIEATKYWFMVCLNREHEENNLYKSYFQLNTDKGPIYLESSFLLYSIQPQERDAYLFSCKASESINNKIHELFPEDESFDRHYSFCKFEDRVEDAKRLFQTDTPFEDIDDIICYINGIEPSKPLNQIMWKAVQETQKQGQTHEKENLVNKIFNKFKNNNHCLSDINELNRDDAACYEKAEEVSRY